MKRNETFRNNPELAAELDLTKNKGLTYKGKPIDVLDLSCGTNKKLDWKCSTCSHEWRTTGNSRVSNGNGCPACANKAIHIDGRNSMFNTHPQLAKEYQGDATEIIAGTHQKLDWKCSTCEHEWKTTGSHRVAGKGCPACANQVIHIDGRNSMFNTHPELAVEYQGDATKIIAGTRQKLDWKCSTCEHEWKAAGSDRMQGKGCPACASKAIHSDGRNSMFNTHPKLANEFQGDASKIIAGTNKKLDWKCRTCSHKWKATGTNRVAGKGCPACANKAIHSDGRNSMANTHPELAKEYQGDPKKIIAGTNKKLDWKCSTCSHKWRTGGNKRVMGRGCPVCATSGYDPSKKGYVYILLYSDNSDIWCKCGISNVPDKRFNQLRRSAKKESITVTQKNEFSLDGQIAQKCEQELLNTEEIRLINNYDIDGKAEFFKYDALDTIMEIINKYLSGNHLG